MTRHLRQHLYGSCAPTAFVGLLGLALFLGLVGEIGAAAESHGAAVGPAGSDMSAVQAAQLERNATLPYALLMVIDGLPVDMFEQLLAAGDLPNLDAHVLRRGYRSEHHTSTFPPVTFSAMASLLTGDLPASHGIPNFQWVNRDTGNYRNYIGLDLLNYQADLLRNTKSVFQYFPNERTLSFGLQVSSGANYQRGIVASFLDPLRGAKDTAYIEKAIDPNKRRNPIKKAVDLVNPGADANLLTLANPIAPGGLLRSTLASLSPEQRRIRGQIPRLVAYYEWDTDKLGHAHGLDHPVVRKSLRAADATFGKLVRLYQEAGLYDQTYFVLASDHGQAPTKPEYVPIDAHFAKLGFRVKFISHELGVKRPKLKRMDSVVGSHTSVSGANKVMCTTGAGAMHIDLVKDNGRGEDLSALWNDQLEYGDLLVYETDDGQVNLVDAFNAIPQNDFGLVRETPFLDGQPHRTRVFNSEGSALITRHPGTPVQYAYEVLAGDDPLGYASHPGTRELVGGPPLDDRAWLAACAGAFYSDGVVMLSQIMELDNSGSVILVPKDGMQFNAEAKTRHGGLLSEEMRTLFAIAGPSLQPPDGAGTFPLSRTIDIVPTLLYALDQPGVDYTEFDGVVVPELKALLDAARLQSTEAETAAIDAGS